MKGARINFGVPNSEYVLLADDDGVAVSLKNQDTDTEYVGGGGRGANPVNITWVNLPETFSNYGTIALFLTIRNDEIESGYELADSDTASPIIVWDDEWFPSNIAMAYNSKAENGEYCFAAPQNYRPTHKIVVVSGDADDSNSEWLEVFGDCTLTIEAV